MRRTEQRQGLGKFEEVYGRTRRGVLSQGDAALGVSERTFRRWRDRYEAEGAERDRRLGRVSARRVGVDKVAQRRMAAGAFKYHERICRSGNALSEAVPERKGPNPLTKRKTLNTPRRGRRGEATAFRSRSGGGHEARRRAQGARRQRDHGEVYSWARTPLSVGMPAASWRRPVSRLLVVEAWFRNRGTCRKIP